MRPITASRPASARLGVSLRAWIASARVSRTARIQVPPISIPMYTSSGIRSPMWYEQTFRNELFCRIATVRITGAPRNGKNQNRSRHMAMDEDLTPMRQQYLEIKANYPDAIVLFRLGDFYETFDHDAEIAARELDLTLTAPAANKGQ